MSIEFLKRIKKMQEYNKFACFKQKKRENKIIVQVFQKSVHYNYAQLPL